jgi:hypothetical protein
MGGPSWRAPSTIRIPLVAAAGNGDIVSQANPYGRAVTATQVSGTVTGLVGFLYVEIVDP